MTAQNEKSGDPLPQIVIVLLEYLTISLHTLLISSLITFILLLLAKSSRIHYNPNKLWLFKRAELVERASDNFSRIIIFQASLNMLLYLKKWFIWIEQCVSYVNGNYYFNPWFNKQCAENVLEIKNKFPSDRIVNASLFHKLISIVIKD